MRLAGILAKIGATRHSIPRPRPRPRRGGWLAALALAWAGLAAGQPVAVVPPPPDYAAGLASSLGQALAEGSNAALILFIARYPDEPLTATARAALQARPDTDPRPGARPGRRDHRRLRPGPARRAGGARRLRPDPRRPPARRRGRAAGLGAEVSNGRARRRAAPALRPGRGECCGEGPRPDGGLSRAPRGSARARGAAQGRSVGPSGPRIRHAPRRTRLSRPPRQGGAADFVDGPNPAAGPFRRRPGCNSRGRVGPSVRG